MTDTIKIEKEELPQEEIRQERMKVSAEQLMDTVRKLFKEASVRRIIIKNPEGRTLLELPVVVGVLGIALFHVWAAIGVIAAVAMDYTIVVERVAESKAI